MRTMPLCGATLGAAALLAVIPAGAGARDIAGLLTSTGGVSVTFSGDFNRGCAKAGLCGYSGSVEVPPRKRRGEYFLSFEHGHAYESESGVALAEPGAVVVRRDEGGPAPGTCTDRDEELELGLVARAAPRGRVRFSLLSPDMSTGRCAGPALERALLQLPPRVVALKRVSGGNATLDLSGRVPFSSGRFSGVMTSTLQFHLGRAGPGSGRIRARRAVSARQRLVRVASLQAVYRIVRYRGELSASFAGLTGPPCADLDACGVTGSATWRIDASGGELSVDAAGRARRSDHGLRGAIAAIRRRGAYVYPDADVPYVFGTTTADVSRPDGAHCHDAVLADSPGIDVGPRSRVELGGPDAVMAAADLLRAGCPGPRDFDAFRYGTIASAPLRLTSLARRRFALRLAGARRLRGPCYSGSATGRFTLRLERRTLRVAYRRARYVLPP
jgi:hypothetical protein